MVHTCFQGQQAKAVLVATLGYERLTGGFHLSHQNLAAILRHPHEAISNLIASPPGFSGLQLLFIGLA
jgi:hypothetical protein